MFSKRPSRANEPTPRRRRAIEDDPNASPAQSSNQFRRNQTLSSYRSNTPEESSRQKAHTLTLQRRRLGGIFLGVALVAASLLFLLWQLIVQVQVSTSTKQLTSSFDTTVYEKAINDYFGLNPAQRLRLTLDEKALSAFVSTQHPEVESLSLSNSLGLARSNFSVTFRAPVAGWQINSRQFYVDPSGVVFEKNYYESPTVQIIDESGVSPEEGSAVVGSRMLSFLGRVVAEAEGRGLTVITASLPQDTTRQLDIFFDGIQTRITLSIDRGAGEQIEDAERSLKYLQSRGMNPEYIDVRVQGRAAYK